ncbi:MAG: carboxypeptidase-like regulatory domain-containing protein [Mucilaginibacter sp.]|uniref:carboxypeptidase-like regulatory domain-containing protein n=1 Tax=Mucilaginibacter sp. TaxID=1882438 RepID=UPI0032665119
MQLNKLFLILLICLFVSSICYAQVISLYGKVADSKTGKAIPGASVRIAKSATSTNSLGEFNIVLNQPDAVQYGIMVSCIGYQSKHVAYQQSGVYNIKLEVASNIMHEVEIAANAESIIGKAIRKIPQNYPDKDFTMQGILRIQETSKDSVGAYLYYKNDAVLEMYYPAYTKSEDIQVSLIQNRFSRLKNSIHDADSVRWMNGYLLVPRNDIVHSRTGFVSLKEMKKFTYTNQGKTSVNNTRVYEINFYAENISGTLYIDTASYAFVNVSYTRYRIKRLFQVPIDQATYTINYKKRDGKWYLEDVKSSMTGKHSGLTLDYMMGYKTTGIDTGKAETIKYQDWLQPNSENIKINKPGTDADWQKYRDLFDHSVKDSVMVSIPVPKIDTTPKKLTGGQKTANGIFGYLTGGNIRTSVQFSKVPLSIAYYQPVLSKNIAAAAVYTMNFSMGFRLYKQLYFTYGGDTNFGIGGIKENGTDYLLSYSFKFNKKYHPVTLSPLFGFNRITLTDNKTEYFNQKSLSYGFNATYELKHWLKLTAGLRYLQPVNTYNGGLLLNSQNLYPSFGIQF